METEKVVENGVNKPKEFYENKIIKSLSKNNVNDCTIHFNYQEIFEIGFTVEVVTYNPKTDVKFLFCQRSSKDSYEEALYSILEYAENYEKNSQEYSYTILWKKEKDDDDSLKTSYFRGVDERDVIDKFYHENNEGYIRIYELKLNPLS